MKLKEFTVLRIRTTTKVEVAKIEINARDEADALVLARYKNVPDYYFHEDYDQAGSAERDELKPAEPEVEPTADLDELLPIEALPSLRAPEDMPL